MALMVGAALLLPITALGQAAMGPITPAERAALSPDRGMLETGWSVANTACARAPVAQKRQGTFTRDSHFSHASTSRLRVVVVAVADAERCTHDP